MKLYELVSDFRNFIEAVDNDEIPEEAIVDTLESIELLILLSSFSMAPLHAFDAVVFELERLASNHVSIRFHM